MPVKSVETETEPCASRAVPGTIGERPPALDALRHLAQIIEESRPQSFPEPFFLKGTQTFDQAQGGNLVLIDVATK
jgi:hypothetical protein